MKQIKNTLLFVLMLMAGQVAFGQTAPVITSWLLNTTNLTGYNGIEANVQSVQYSTNYVYVSSSGIPAYSIGPWSMNPGTPTDQNWVFKIPRNPVEKTGTKTSTPLGNIALFINGVPAFNAKDAASYNSLGIWNQNALYFEASSMDACLGHPAPGQSATNARYHHHQNPKCLYTADPTTHSPIIGYAFDGFPIYGPYAYSNVNGTGSITRMRTGYKTRNITARTTLPSGATLTSAQYGPSLATYPLGAYIEDYEYVAGWGDLDAYNGRFCVTPEYPNGIYAYFITIDANGNSEYPYILGPQYYGTVEASNQTTGGHVTISESVTTYTPSTQTTCSTPTGLMVLSITNTSAVASWTAVASATNYKVQYKATSSSTWSEATVSATSYSLTNLTYGTAYEVKVTANCSSGTSTASSAVSFTTTTPTCSAPTNLQYASVTNNSAVLSWTAAAGASSYKVQYRAVGSNATWSEATTSSTTYTLSNLTGTTYYEVRVVTNCNLISSDASSTVAFRTLASPCAAATNLVPSRITETSAMVTWTAATGATGYILQYRPVNTTTWTEVTLTATTYTLSNLSPATVYEVQVVANCAGGSPSTSNPIRFLTYSVNCSAPTQVLLTAIGETTASITWQGAASAIGYKVQYKAAAETTWTEVAVTTTTYNFVGLLASTSYEVRVTSVCAGYVMSSYNSIQFMTRRPTCPTVRDVAVSQINAALRTATISWTAVSGVIAYKVLYQPAGGTLTELTAQLNQITLTNLTPGVDYVVFVYAVCSGNLTGGLSDAARFTIPQSSCGTPENLWVNAFSSNSAVLNWTAVPGATGYLVEYKTLDATTWTMVTTMANSTSIGGLTQGTAYTFRVTAGCGSERSTTSAPLGFVTTPTSDNGGGGGNTCPTPTGLWVQNNADGSVVLNWIPAPGADHYTVKLKDRVTNVITEHTVPNNMLMLSGLVANRDYEFTVTTTCGDGGESSASAMFPFRVRVRPFRTGLAANDNGVTAYPNPTTDLITIRLEQVTSGTVNAAIYDLQGKMVKAATYMLGNGVEEFTIPVHSIAPGRYWLFLETDTQNWTKSIEVIR